MKFRRSHQSEPFDPRLSPLLERVLAPGRAPAGLADKIAAATGQRLARAAARPAVLAYIGFMPVARALAAAIICAALLGIGFVSGGICRDAHAIVRGEVELAALPKSLGPSSRIDQEIQVLEANVDATRQAFQSESGELGGEASPATPDSRNGGDPSTLF